MKERTEKDYLARIDKVLSYLSSHLDEPYDLYRLADEACLAPFHFHRIYTAMTNETVAETVRRMRLQRAGALLLTSDRDIGLLAKGAGYGSVQAFGRAFRIAYGISPAAYRRQGGVSLQAKSRVQLRDGYDHLYEVAIEMQDTLPVVAMAHQGPYRDVGFAVERLANWFAGKRMLGPRTRVFAVFHDDPGLIAMSRLRAEACVSAVKASEIKDPFYKTELIGGRYAVVVMQGPAHETETVFNWLYGQWLPSSGEAPADAPCYIEHIGDPRSMPTDKLQARVYLPLKE